MVSEVELAIGVAIVVVLLEVVVLANKWLVLAGVGDSRGCCGRGCIVLRQ